MKYFLGYLLIACFTFFLLPIGFLFFIFKMDLAPSVVFGLIGGALFLQVLDVAGLGWREFLRKKK